MLFYIVSYVLNKIILFKGEHKMNKNLNQGKPNTKVSEKKISWMDLSEEEILKVTDVSVCMYGKQDNSISFDSSAE